MRSLGKLGIAAMISLAACKMTVNGKPVGEGGGGGAGGGEGGATLPGQLEFPPAAPQSGETRGCPSREILARRFEHQNDMNGGGFGYYFVELDQDRRQSISQPRMPTVELTLDNRKSDDDGLRYLWGTYCAYPDSPAVKQLLDTWRAQYQQTYHVSAETEETLHKAMIDTVAVEAERDALCKRDRDDGVRGVVASVVCNGRNDRRGTIVRRAWTQVDRGETSIVYPAAVVGTCADLGEVNQGQWQILDGRYVRYRLCRLDRDRVEPAALSKALAKAKLGDYTRLRFLATFETGAAIVDAQTAEMAKHDKGYPGDKQLFEDALAVVHEKYAPAFIGWRRTLDAIDAWYPTLADGPGMAEGCVEKLGAMLQEYVDATVPGAKGEALLDALRDPIGYHITEALAVCHRTLGDEAKASVLWYRILPGGVRVDNVHDALWHVLRRSYEAGKVKHYSTWAASVRMDEVPPNPAFDLLGEPPYSPGDYGGRFTSEETVASVSTDGDDVIVKFPKKPIEEVYLTDCKEDFSKPRSIDQYGNIHYDWYGCKEVTKRSKIQKPPIRISKAEGAKIAKGMVVASSIVPDATRSYRELDQEPVDAAVVWVKKGKDVIWAGGVGVK